MSAYLTATIYAAIIFLAALAGGWVPLVVRLTHTRMQVALSFVAGVILGIGLLHLVPHGYMQLHNIDQTVRWALGGFLVMFFLQWFLQFHHHDAPANGDHSHELAHSHAHRHEHTPHDPPHPPLKGRVSWVAAFVGLALHGLLDGVAVAAAIQAESGSAHAEALAGIGTFLAVVLHKPFDSLMIGTLMAARGSSRRWRHITNLLYACVTPLGIAAFFLGVHSGKPPILISLVAPFVLPAARFCVSPRATCSPKCSSTATTESNYRSRFWLAWR